MKQLSKCSETAKITETSKSGGLSRREFVCAATGLVAAVVGNQAEGLAAEQPGNRRQPAGGRILLKGGVVLTCTSNCNWGRDAKRSSNRSITP